MKKECESTVISTLAAIGVLTSSIIGGFVYKNYQSIKSFLSILKLINTRIEVLFFKDERHSNDWN